MLLSVLLALTVIMLTARIVGAVFAKFNQPAVIGEVVGGILLAQQWSIPRIFLLGALPALIAAVAVFAMGQLRPDLPGRQSTSASPSMSMGH